jgi:hypothetical protein
MPVLLLILFVSLPMPLLTRLDPAVDVIVVAGDATLGPGQITITVSPTTGTPPFTIGGALTLNQPPLVIVNTAPIPAGSVIRIMDVLSAVPVNGTFLGLAEGALLTTATGQWFRVSYVGGTGNDVTLTALDTTSVPFLGGPQLALLLVALAVVGLTALRAH